MSEKLTHAPSSRTDAKYAEQEVEQFVQILRKSDRWLTAARLSTHMGWKPNEDSKRIIRSMASKSQEVISGPEGYRHAMHATEPEVRRFIATMESQCKAMLWRVEGVRQYVHERTGKVL